MIDPMTEPSKVYKIFCVACEWWIGRESDSCLWKDLITCPDCDSPTDAIRFV